MGFNSPTYQGFDSQGANITGNGPGPTFLGGNMYDYQPYQIDYSAFQNPAGNYGQQLGSAAMNLPSNAGTVQAASSPYTTAGTQGQLALAGQYGQMAAGHGPSLANVQAQQQGAQNLAVAQSMLGSARGAGSPAAAQLAAQQAQASGAQQVAQNAVQGRTNEELAAMQAQGNLLGSVASTGQNEQQMQNQIALTNQAARQQALQQQLQAYMSENAQQQAGAQAGQQLGVQNSLGSGQIQSQAFNNAAVNQQKLAGSLFSGVGGLVGGML